MKTQSINKVRNGSVKGKQMNKLKERECGLSE